LNAFALFLSAVFPDGATHKKERCDAIDWQKLDRRAETGWQLYVENVSGAGGLVGALMVARATLDGCTLLLCNVACAANQFVVRHRLDPKSAIAANLGRLSAEHSGRGASLPINILRVFIEQPRANP
jgi:hypothetical protein